MSDELLQLEIEFGVTEEALHILNTAIANHPEESLSASGRVHECGICGHKGAWGGSWMWFGSYREIEEGDTPIVTCSRKCFEEACRQRIVNVKKNRRSDSGDATNTAKRRRFARRDLR